MRFFKIIDERIMEDKKLRLPKLFLRAFGNQLSDLASVSVSDGRVWLIELTKKRKDVWFYVGLDEFFNHYSIRERHLLIFTWKGDSAFDVLLFDASTCETQYPAVNDSEEVGHHGEIEETGPVEMMGDVESATILEEDDDLETSENEEADSSYGLEADKRKKLGKRKASGNSKRAKGSCSRKKGKGNGADDVILVNSGEENGVTTRTPGSKVATRLSQWSMRNKYPGYRPKNAHFMFLLREYNVKRMGYIPMGFAKHNLDRSLTSIRVFDGNKEWTLGILWRMMKQNKAKDLYIYKGWEEFLKENELKVGDVFGFELIRKEPEVTLKFTKVHTA